jgi:hypothetical protein
MKRLALLGILPLLLLLAAACSEANGSTPDPGNQPGATPTTPAQPSATPSPVPDVSSPTGIPAVDAAINAVLNGNIAALDGMIEYQDAACVATQHGAGGPPICVEGEVAGTTVRVFPVAYCEGTFSRDARLILEDFVSQGLALHSVVQAPDEPRVEPYWPVGDTFVNFVSSIDSREVGTRLVIEDGKIVMAFFGCLHTPGDLMQHRGEPLEVIYQPAS